MDRHCRHFGDLSSPPNVSSILKIGNDFMSGSLGHPNIIRDFPSRTRRVMRYVAENQTMVRDEGPPRGRRGLRGLRGLGLLQREGSKLEISFKGSESITVQQKSQQRIFRFSLAIPLATSITNHFEVSASRCATFTSVLTPDPVAPLTISPFVVKELAIAAISR